MQPAMSKVTKADTFWSFPSLSTISIFNLSLVQSFDHDLARGPKNSLNEQDQETFFKIFRFADELASVQDVADWVDCASDGHLWALPDQRGGLHTAFGGT